MKLTTILLFATTMLVSASVYSQSTRLTLNFTDISYVELFQRIEKQTEFRFAFSSSKFDPNTKISVNVAESTLEKVLDEVLPEDITYEIVDRYVVIHNAEMTRDITGNQQSGAISGKVTDTSGTPLPGVTVAIKGTTRGTITDAGGNFSLQNIPSDAILVFSFVGMKMQEIPVAGKTSINVAMDEETIGIDEVVAVGYGTQKKVNVTGAVSVISDEHLVSRSSSTVSQLLQGQTSGISFDVPNTGFQPGASMSLTIRGMGSINGSSPLVVIDGVPGTMDRLNPEDIESISVLKDASSAAIYGARAAYGVILISTKSGLKRDIRASYNGNVSYYYPMQLADRLDSYTFARVHNEAAQNLGARYYSNAVVDRIIAYQSRDWDYLGQFMPEGVTHYETVPKSDGTWGVKWDGNADNDWSDIMFGKSVNHKHNFSIDGGTEKLSYYFSAGYLKENGYINYMDDSYGRYNVSGKITSEVTDWWSFTIKTNFTKGIRTIPSYLSMQQFRTFFEEFSPTYPLYDGYGNYNKWIRYLQEGGDNKSENTENLMTFYTTLKPVKGLQVNADFTYRSNDQFQSIVNKKIPDILTNQTKNYGNATNSVSNRHNNNYYWSTNVYASYDLNLTSGHNFRIMAGTQFEYSRSRYMNSTKNDLLVEDVPSLATAIGDFTVSEDLNHWATEGYFGRFN